MKKKATLILFLLTIPTLIFAAEYGSMYITNNSTDQGDLGDADTWYQVTGFSEMITSADWTFSADELTGDEDCAGKYLLRFSLSFKATAALWAIAVDINGTKYGIVERRISTSSDVGNVSGCCLVDVGNSQSAALYVKANADPTSFTPIHSQVVMVEMCQATTPKFGEMQIVNNSTAQTTITSFTNLSNFISTHSNLEGWTFGSNALTSNSGSAGTYLAILSVSFNGATEENYELGVSIDGNAPYGGSSDTDIVLKRYLGTSGDVGNGGACGILTISESDVISVQVKSIGNSITAEYASLTLVKLADNTTPPYAGMKVDDNINTISLPQSALVKEVNFASDILNSTFWDFSAVDDELTPKGLSAGDYLVNYYLSLSVPVSGDAAKTFNTLFDIFNNGSQLYDLTTERTLEKKQTAGGNPDVAAINGTAIITIENPDDALYLQLQNVDQASEMSLIVRYSNVNLFRLKTKGDGTLPVELSAFTGQYINNVPTLYWSTQTETDNLGWNVYRNNNNDFTSAERVNNELLRGHGTTTQVQNYYYEDMSESLVSGNDYWYWLESIDYGGTINHYDRVALIHIPTIQNPNPNNAIPKKYGLQSGPNPFNSNLEISYMLHETDMVRIEIYNMVGQLIAQFDEGLKTADKHYTLDWNGKDIYGQNVETGVLLIKLITTQGSETTKAILLR